MLNVKSIRSKRNKSKPSNATFGACKPRIERKILGGVVLSIKIERKDKKNNRTRGQKQYWKSGKKKRKNK